MLNEEKQELVCDINTKILDNSKTDAETQFWALSDYLNQHHLSYLYSALHASGITSYTKAVEWLKDYYSNTPEKKVVQKIFIRLILLNLTYLNLTIILALVLRLALCKWLILMTSVMPLE